MRNPHIALPYAVLLTAFLLAGAGCKKEPATSSPPTPQLPPLPIAAPAALTERQKIAALLDTVEKAGDLVFIRNDQEYPASAARRLMDYKIDAAGDDVTTAEDFIRKVATRSKTTGRSYQVRFADGRTTESAFWLRARLAEIEGGTGPSGNPGAGP